MTIDTAPPDMTYVRSEIDRIDIALMKLLAERASVIDLATAAKRVNGMPARTVDRVAQVVANARANAEREGFDPDFAEKLWRDLIEWSIAREETGLGESV